MHGGEESDQRGESQGDSVPATVQNLPKKPWGRRFNGKRTQTRGGTARGVNPKVTERSTEEKPTCKSSGTKDKSKKPLFGIVKLVGCKHK